MALKKVLLVEDSGDDQLLGKRAFSRFDKDIEVVCAFDGVEAVELLSQGDFTPDLILLDINMPRMDGLEFLDRYCGGGTPEMPPIVVMLTSSEQESDKSKSLTYETVKDYMVKPIRKESIDGFIELLQSLDSA